MLTTTTVKRWLTALRSGEYKQTRFALKRPLSGGKVGYCCLGVLCEVAGLGTFDEQPSSAPPPAEYEERPRFTEAFRFTPKSNEEPVAERLRFEMPPPALLEEVGLIGGPYLAEMNDSGASFEQIARYIEERY